MRNTVAKKIKRYSKRFIGMYKLQILESGFLTRLRIAKRIIFRQQF